jgi:hypothetical protein
MGQKKYNLSKFLFKNMEILIKFRACFKMGIRVVHDL